MDFELPDNWMYARLGNIITLTSGRDLDPTQYNSTGDGIPYITGASNIEGNNVIINRWTKYPVVISKKGELLITCKGTIGAMAYNSIGDIHIARQIMSIYSPTISLSYIKIFLESYISVLQSKAKSMIPGISRDDLLNAVIPIPPLQEQYRIIDTINRIVSKIKGEN